MGRVKNLFTRLVNKTSNYFDNSLPSSALSLADVTKTEEFKKETLHYEMPLGERKTEEELIQDNMMIISALDPKINFILQLINEFGEDNLDSLYEFASDPMTMKLWLAHYSYKTQVDSFYNFIKDSKTVPNNRKIKCITDLPLQKKLLN